MKIGTLYTIHAYNIHKIGFYWEMSSFLSVLWMLTDRGSDRSLILERLSLVLSLSETLHVILKFNVFHLGFLKSTQI